MEVSEIVNILIINEGARTLIAGWNKFYDHLGTPSPNFNKWKDNYNSNSSYGAYELFKDILEHWISVKHSAATTNELETILRKGEFNASADEVKALGEKQIRTNLISHSNTPKVWFEIAQSTTNFVGRESQLQKLTTFYKDQKNNLVVISGFAGIGKSEIVKKFASIFSKDFNGHCIWLQGDSEDSFNKSMKRLSEQLNIDYSKAVENAQFLFSTLKPDPILVIIDNVDKENNQVINFLRASKLLKMPLPFIIVTSRLKTILDSAGNHIEMETLETSQAKKIVQDSLEFQTNDDDVIKLCEELHNFPLILQQAIGYIKNERLAFKPNFNIADYLQLLRTKKVQLYDHPLGVDHTYSSTTIASWNITFDNIRQKHKLIGPSTILLLRILAYSDPDGENIEYLVDFHQGIIQKYFSVNVHKKLFLFFHAETREIEEEIKLLQSYSLCKTETKTSYTFQNERWISVHRLVAEVVRLSFSKDEEINFLDKSLSRESRYNDNMVFDINHQIWPYATQFDSLFQKYFPRMIKKTFVSTYDSNVYEILLEKAVNWLGWKNQKVLDFELKVLESFLLSKADKYIELYLTAYKRLKIDFGVDHENFQRLLTHIDGGYFLFVDFNKFKEADFSVLVELLINLIQLDDWSTIFTCTKVLQHLFISIITALNPLNLLKQFDKITNIVKNVVKKNKKRQKSLWMLKIISNQLKKFKQFDEFKLVQVQISDSMFHPSEKILIHLTTFSLFDRYNGSRVWDSLIKRNDFKLLKLLFKLDINYHCLQTIINARHTYFNEHTILERTKAALNTLQLLYKKGTCSTYDALCITSHLKLVLSRRVSLIEKWETENPTLKVNHSMYFNKTIQVTNTVLDFQICSNLIDENEKFEETTENKYNSKYPIDFQNGKFVWLIKERIPGLLNRDVWGTYLMQNKDLRENMNQLRIENAKSCLNELTVLVEGNELDRSEACWSIKELCGFLYFRKEDKFVVNLLSETVIPICFRESELNVIKKLLNQIAFQLCSKLDECEKYDDIEEYCELCEKIGLGNITESIDSAIEIFFELFKLEFHFPLLKAIVQSLAQMKQIGKILKLKERFTKINIKEMRSSLKEEINIALGIINNAKADKPDSSTTEKISSNRARRFFRNFLGK